MNITEAQLRYDLSSDKFITATEQLEELVKYILDYNFKYPTCTYFGPVTLSGVAYGEIKRCPTCQKIRVTSCSTCGCGSCKTCDYKWVCMSPITDKGVEDYNLPLLDYKATQGFVVVKQRPKETQERPYQLFPDGYTIELIKTVFPLVVLQETWKRYRPS